MMDDNCANCGHAQNLHFPWCIDPYIRSCTSLEHDLCGCRDYKYGGLDASQTKAPQVAQEEGSISRMEEQAQDKTPEEVLDIVDAWLYDHHPERAEIFSWQVVWNETYTRVKSWRDKQ
jgi:hypothetical protein